ncbi:Ig-like domain-containing protein, partial [Leucobacter sp. OLAS13]
MAKKNVKRLGALGLAGALALGGIVVADVVQAAPASAAEHRSVLKPGEERLIGPWVYSHNAGAYQVGRHQVRDGKHMVGWHYNYSDAVKQASVFSLPAVGKVGPIIGPDGKCLGVKFYDSKPTQSTTYGDCSRTGEPLMWKLHSDRTLQLNGYDYFLDQVQVIRPSVGSVGKQYLEPLSKYVVAEFVSFHDAESTVRRPILAGTGHPGAQVEVKDQDGTSLGTVTVGEDGKWSLAPTADLAEGSNMLTAVQTPKDGGETSEATATITVEVAAEIAELVVTGPTPGATVESETPTVSGTAEPGAKITVTGPDGEKLGETVADENGDWTLTLPKQPEGDLSITVTDEHGGKEEIDFTVKPAAPAGPDAGGQADPNTGANGTDEDSKDSNTNSASEQDARANMNASASAAASANADGQGNAKIEGAAQAAAFSDATAIASAAADVSAKAAAQAAALATA